MGYLTDITPPLSYTELKSLSKYIKEHGITQFLHLYKKFKDLEQDQTYWGDEIELHLLNIDPVTKTPRLQLNNSYMFETLKTDAFELQPECGSWMLETVPHAPYEYNGDPNVLLENFKTRRQTISSLCRDGDVLFEGTVFPMLKVGKDYFIAKYGSETRDEKDFSYLGKDFFPEIFNSHPRFMSIVESVRQYRGENVSILAPLYQDVNTSMDESAESKFIKMEEEIFGTGNTSIQVTFGTKNIEEARYLADQIAVFSSIVLPLSAATAIFNGKLADVDVRWNVLSACTDCRNKEERDPSSSQYKPVARGGVTSYFISTRSQCKDMYNDIPFPVEKDMMKFATETASELGIEIDDRLLTHLGFLFKQNPLVAFPDKIYVDDTKNTNHFESLQSTNWNNVRFKPPPSFDSKCGWRVELRTMEAQLTAEENVAMSMFSYFFATMVMKRSYNFYIPMSKVHENFTRGHRRNAVISEKFWFRKDIRPDSADEWTELSMDEILHGKPDVFVGLLPLIYTFCKEEYGVDMQAEWAQKKADESVKVSKVTENMRYFEMLSQRARGERPTIAAWIRAFVLKHPDYQSDSVVTPKIAADLVEAMLAISDGKKAYSDYNLF